MAIYASALTTGHYQTAKKKSLVFGIHLAEDKSRITKQ